MKDIITDMDFPENRKNWMIFTHHPYSNDMNEYVAFDVTPSNAAKLYNQCAKLFGVMRSGYRRKRTSGQIIYYHKNFKYKTNGAIKFTNYNRWTFTYTDATNSEPILIEYENGDKILSNSCFAVSMARIEIFDNRLKYLFETNFTIDMSFEV